MGEELTDVKPGSASSADKGVIDDSPSSKPDAQQDVNQGSMLDAVRKAVGTQLDETEESSDSDKAQAEESGSETEQDKSAAKAETVDSQKEPAAEGDETTKTDEKAEDDKGPVPYERFQEVVQKHQTLEKDYQAAKPLAEVQQKIIDFCNSNSITHEQFSTALEIAALLNTNPQKAAEKLIPIVQELQGTVGDRLPDDLAKEVTAGDLSLERAKELAKLRAESKFGARRQELNARQMQERQMQEAQKAMSSAVESWTAHRVTSDPDFKPKAKAEDVDGKYELTYSKFVAKLQERNARGEFTNPVRSPQDMVALMERAYTEVNAVFEKAFRRPATRKPITSNGSQKPSPRGPESAKTLLEALRPIAERHGIS